MKKLKKRFLFLAVLLLLAGCQKKMTVQDYLNLGDKYLTEANYEEAIVAFTKAIELEPKAIKAYEGLAGAYIKTGAYDKAEAAIQSGIAVYEGLTADEQTDAYKQIYEALLKLQDEVAGQLDKDSGEANSQSEEEAIQDSADREQEPLVAEAKEKYGSILEQIIAVINSQTPTETHYFTDDFQGFVKGLEKPMIWQWQDEQYLGLYCGTDGDVYVYLGEMDHGIRSGYGSWYGEYEYADEGGAGEGTNLFYGNWTNDYPNGAGTEISVSGNLKYKIQGNYLDGYEDGTINEIDEDVFEGSTVTDTYTYTATHGIPHTLYRDEDGEIVVAEAIENRIDEEAFLVYEEGNTWGVSGAMKN